MTPELLENIAAVAGAVLTLAIFSYLLGDNVLYRIAIHVFIGAAAGFVLITAIESVIVPWTRQMLLAQPLEAPRFVVGMLPFLLAVLLLFKGTPRLSGLGTLGLVVVIGVGAAVALWGATRGTLIPLTESTVQGFTRERAFDGFIVLIGTVSVLMYFLYLGVRRSSGEVQQLLPVRVTGLIGQAFIAVALGAVYALLIISALTALNGVIANRLLGLGG